MTQQRIHAKTCKEKKGNFPLPISDFFLKWQKKLILLTKTLPESESSFCTQTFPEDSYPQKHFIIGFVSYQMGGKIYFLKIKEEEEETKIKNHEHRC